MPHSYAQNTIHLIFSTKDRRKLLPKELQPKLWAYIAGVCKNHQIEVEAIGGTDDHIHLLIRGAQPVRSGAADQIEFVEMVE